jgi:hypothetical protein
MRIELRQEKYQHRGNEDQPSKLGEPRLSFGENAAPIITDGESRQNG